MPYIVTTKRPVGVTRSLAPACKVSRRAVATLEEARARAWEALYEHADMDCTSKRSPVDDIPESGGTVGPLPDGTVIDVSPRATSDLAASVLMANDYHFGEATEAEVIAAYNAKAGQ